MKRVIKASFENMDVYDRIDIAEDLNTQPETLAQLAGDEDWKVRKGVAGNLNTSPELLAKLAGDKDRDVRTDVATNPNTPPKVLVKLAGDISSIVRYYVAKNPNTPPEALSQLVRDTDGDVRDRAAKNPNTPREATAKARQPRKKSWPSPDEFSEMGEEEAWDRYFSGPESEVADELQVFFEPSTQGGVGGMFIFDESGADNESIEVDYSDWIDTEFDIAQSVKSEKSFKTKFKKYVQNLIKGEGWVR